jgi:DNA-binding NarL/FixJ family response regulator
VWETFTTVIRWLSSTYDLRCTSPQASADATASMNAMPRRRLPPEHIPGRLRRIVPLLGDLKTNDEIAAELSLSRHTVENYVSELMHLIGARDRLQLVTMIRESAECE